MSNEWRKTQFTTDGDNTYEGYTCGEKWNGFACPYFERDTAIDIIKRSLRPEVDDGFRDIWGESENGDLWVFWHEDQFEATNGKTEEGGHKIEYREIYEKIAVEIDGIPKTLWGIGVFYWVWKEKLQEIK